MAERNISLCMIVKDEARCLGACIDSVKELVDEIVIVDTGSSDGTVDIARTHGARIFDFRWCDDFSEARNFSIRNASSEWVMALDADEVISRRDHAAITALADDEDYDGFRFLARNYTYEITDLWRPNEGDYAEGRDYPGYDETPIVRFFRNRKDIRYHGNIHEIVGYQDGRPLKQKDVRIPVHHYGKVRDAEKLDAKYSRYLEMNLRKIELEGENPKAYFELDRQYFECGMYEKAAESFEISLRLDPGGELARFDLAVSCLKIGRFDEAEKVLRKLVEDKPSSNAHALLGAVYMETGDLERALVSLGNALEMEPGHVLACNNMGIIHSRLEHYDRSVPFFETALKINPRFTQARGNLAVAYERKQDWKNALKTYTQLLEMEPESAHFVESRLRAIEKCLKKRK